MSNGSMADLIYREQAIAIVNRFQSPDDTMAKFEVVDLLKDIPSARPKGKWIWDKHNGEYYCSECKEVQEDIKTVMGFPDWNFCPNCGSDMRGEQDDQ